MNLRKINEVYYSVEGENQELSQLKNALSFFVPGAQFTDAYKNKSWNGLKSFLDYRTRTIPAGLFTIVKRTCENNKYKLRVDEGVKKDITDSPRPDTKSLLENLNLPFEPRDYQIEQFETAAIKRRGVVVSPTGSGKSLVIYMLLRWMLDEVPGKIMLVVPSVSLVEQMWSDFISYGWNEELMKNFVEKLYNKQTPTFKKRILITTYQSVMRKGPDFFEDYRVLMNDEAHSVKSAMLTKIAKMCTNADYRLGFTATIPTEPIDHMGVFGVLGWRIYDLKSFELIDKGYLSQIEVVNLFLDYDDEYRKRVNGRSFNEEEMLLEKSARRLDGFSYVLDRLPETNNTLILVKHLEHLETMKNWLEGKYADKYKIHVIQGSTDPLAREGIRQGMENEKGSVLLATYGTMSTGINIKRIHNIMFGASSKSHIRVLQSIGRGLRTHETKSKLILWDVVDNLTTFTRTGKPKYNYMMKHWNERLNIYREQKFKCLKKTIQLEKENA